MPFLLKLPWSSPSLYLLRFHFRILLEPVSGLAQDVEPKHMPPSIDSESSNYDNAFRTNNESLSKCARKRKLIPSVTSALIVGAILGLIQTFLLIFTAKYSILLMMGGKPMRIIAVTSCVTLASSLASLASCSNQVWMPTSLLANGLDVASQAMIVAAFVKFDHYKVVVSTARVLKMSIVLELCLSIFLRIGLSFGANNFGKDADVITVVHQSILLTEETYNQISFMYFNSQLSPQISSQFKLLFSKVIEWIHLL